MSIGLALQRMFPLRWERRRTFRLPTGAPLEPYPIEWSAGPPPEGEGWEAQAFDAAGVLLIDGRYNPVDIAQFALTCFQRRPQTFLKQADFLRDAQRLDGGYPYEIALPPYGAASGWLSAMAQGEAASVLLRAFWTTDDRRYADAALRALEPLLRDVRDGGVSFLRGNDVFFEEVAVDPHHILNGHLFAAFGLWEAIRAGVADAPLIALHDRAVDTLLRWLPDFDSGGWSCYDLAVDERGERHLAPLGYHHFHIAQLRVYAVMTGRAAFAKQADRWEAALREKSVRRRVWSYGAYWLLNAIQRKAQHSRPNVWHSIDRTPT